MSPQPYSRMPVALRGLFVLLVFFSFTVPAAVLRVPAEYIRIQTAIDASRNGDVVLVNPGVYNENIIFKGKAITLSSTNPVDPLVVNATIIDASGRGSAVTFTNAEGSNSMLTGFTISGGYGTLNRDFGTNTYFGGGIYCLRSAPRIVGNNIVANLSPNGQTNAIGYGGGIACIEASPVIARNRIAGNGAYVAGGILTYLGQARIVSNLIVSNWAVIGGGVAMIVGGQFINNTIAGNEAETAGNIYAASDVTAPVSIVGNIIAQASSGGGVYLETPEAMTLMTFNNVWGNAGGDYVTTNRTGLNGNISQDPLFLDAANEDLRLHETSPCINAGDPNVLPAQANATSMAAPATTPAELTSVPMNIRTISGLSPMRVRTRVLR